MPMSIQELTTPADLARYDQWITAHPEGSLWQSLVWKTYQETIGREVRVYAAMSDTALVASAMVVIDRTTGGMATWDIARGPLGPRMENVQLKIENSMEDLFEKIIRDAQKDTCLSLTFSPMRRIIFNCQFSIINSCRHEQPEATRIVDLTQTEEEILAQMHQKGRYNSKVAEKHGVRVERSTDIEAYYALARATSERDGFRVPSKRQLQAFLKTLPGSFLLLAIGDRPIAGLIGVQQGKTAYYYYGASDHQHRALMAPYLLQWEAMKLCKANGATQYDLLGIAPDDAPSTHPWAGISAFKAKFGGRVVTYPPERQIVLRPALWRLLSLKRRWWR